MKLDFHQTGYKGKERHVTDQTVEFAVGAGNGTELLCIEPDITYQTMDGFGGAATESAGYIYSMLDEEQKKEFLEGYLSEDGMNYRTIRVSMDSCDFSLGHYEADSNPEDEEFKEFSFERMEKYVLPLLEDLKAHANGELNLMLSPWSPPAYMKTNTERNHGGKLLDAYKTRYAHYIVRYIEELESRGFKITRLTIQNEPQAVQTWDSCIYTAEEEKAFIRDYLYPVFVERHMEDRIGIYLWDHNKELVFDWAKTIIDETTNHMIEGLAFHWYSGDHFEQLGWFKKRFPEKKLMMSEACIERLRFDAEDILGNAEKYAHDLIGDLNNGMEMFLDWNLILDEEGGPNHVGNFCDAPYLYDRAKKELGKSAIYDYLWHFSHYIREGMTRIGISRYTDKVETTAFTDGEKIVVVLLNRTEEDIPVSLQLNAEEAKLVIGSRSIATAVIQ